MGEKHVWYIGRWRFMVKFGRYRFGVGRMNGWSSFTWGLGFCCGNVVRRSAKRPVVNVCGVSWSSGLCGGDGLFLHRCARLADHGGSHGCECGADRHDADCPTQNGSTPDP